MVVEGRPPEISTQGRKRARKMFLYDDITDILMINFGQPQEAITDQIGDRIHIRFNPITNEPVGLVITAFKEGFLQEHPDLAKAFETLERILE